jgi:hypothetical protein
MPDFSTPIMVIIAGNDSPCPGAGGEAAGDVIGVAGAFVCGVAFGE